MMAGLADDLLDRILSRVAEAPSLPHEVLAQDLRAHFPGCHLSVCNEDDISPRVSPAAGNAACLLYYVASGEHCLSLTNDAAVATGLVVALRGEDD